MSLDVLASDPAGLAFREAVSASIEDFLAAKQASLQQVSPIVMEQLSVTRDLIAHGKRLRPAFGYWGYIACHGSEDPAAQGAVIRAMASLELMHIGILIHDDVIDDADTRRGLPSAHRRFQAWHAQMHGTGDAETFGTSLAVILGDQLLVWSQEMAERAELPSDAWAAAMPYFHAVRTEVNTGQFLDVCAQFGVRADSDDALSLATRVLEEKTSRYTVQRPVQCGAALALADQTTLATLGDFGLALGRAFQLRDDLLGVFGDPERLGKPAGGDLKEGKRTVLVALTEQAANEAQREVLDAALGDPALSDEDCLRVQQIMQEVGAVDQVEAMITQDYRTALACLDAADLRDDGRQALTELARLCVERDH